MAVVDRALKRKKLVCAKFELSLQMMCSGLTRYCERTILSQAFRKFKENLNATKATEQTRQKHIKKITEM